MVHPSPKRVQQHSPWGPIHPKAPKQERNHLPGQSVLQGQVGWQHDAIFYSTLFSPPVTTSPWETSAPRATWDFPNRTRGYRPKAWRYSRGYPTRTKAFRRPMAYRRSIQTRVVPSRSRGRRRNSWGRRGEIAYGNCPYSTGQNYLRRGRHNHPRVRHSRPRGCCTRSHPKGSIPTRDFLRPRAPKRRRLPATPKSVR